VKSAIGVATAAVGMKTPARSATRAILLNINVESKGSYLRECQSRAFSYPLAVTLSE
jgi:hypothetical protein